MYKCMEKQLELVNEWQNLGVIIDQHLDWKPWCKGYRRYKTITSQNVPSEAQVKNFFVS